MVGQYAGLGVLAYFHDHWYGVLYSTVAGLFVGTAQAFLLRRQVRRASWWSLATALGSGAGSVVQIVVQKGADGTDVFLIKNALFGAALGVSQYAVLRPTFRRSGWWIPASVVAWAAGLVAGETVYKIGAFSLPGLLWFLPSLIAAGAVNGAAGAVVQAFVLTRKGAR